MKKFFTLAMAMLSMVAILASCSKSDDVTDEPVPAPEPEPEVLYNVRLVAPLTDVQLEMMDLTINVTEAGGLSLSITPAKMNKLPLTEFDKYFNELDITSVGKPTIYYVDLAGDFTAEELLQGTVEYVATGKKEGIAKYVKGDFNFFGRARTFVKTVDGNWISDINNPFTYEFMGAVQPTSEKDINMLIDIYNDFGAKTNFTLSPISK